MSATALKALTFELNGSQESSEHDLLRQHSLAKVVFDIQEDLDSEAQHYLDNSIVIDGGE